MKRGGLVMAMTVPGFLLAGCVPTTMVPTIMARPGPGKTPVDFSYDNSACSAQANQQVAVARNAANGQIVGAYLTTDLETTAATASASTASIQQQFDTAYSACMYARGETVPGYAMEMAPVPNPTRRYTSRPKSTSAPASTSSGSGFVEPPPSSSASGGSGFTEPPPAASANNGFSEPPPAQH
jgi:hypothetical protein